MLAAAARKAAEQDHRSVPPPRRRYLVVRPGATPSPRRCPRPPVARSVRPVPEPRLRIAVFPFIDENPYQRLFYDALSAHGFSAGDGELKLGWLVRNRRETRVLHFHWPQSWYRQAAQPGG